MAFGIGSLAIRNITRRPLRAGVLSLGSAVLAFALFIIGSMYLSVTHSVRLGGERLGADAIVVPAGWSLPEGGPLLSGGPTGTYLDAGTLPRVRDYPGVAAASAQLFIVSAPLACCSLSNTVLVGFEPETDFTVTPWLRDEGLKRPLELDEIVIGPDILSEPGGRIRFFDKVFRVAAKLLPTGLPMMDSAVFMPMQSAREMAASAASIPVRIGPGQVSAVLIRFAPHINHAARALRMEYDIPGIRIVLARDAMASAKKDLLAPLNGMAAMSALWWAASLVMAGALYGVMLEGRLGELGLLMSLGASRKHVFYVFTLEVILLSLVGAVAGLAAGWLVIGSILGGLPLAGGASLALVSAAAVCASLASSFLSTAYPLLRSSFRTPSGTLARH